LGLESVQNYQGDLREKTPIRRTTTGVKKLKIKEITSAQMNSWISKRRKSQMGTVKGWQNKKSKGDGLVVSTGIHGKNLWGGNRTATNQKNTY